MMNFEKFQEQFVVAIRNSVSDAMKKVVEVRLQYVEKSNCSYNGCTVTPVDSNVGVTLNLDTIYKEFESEGLATSVAKATDTCVQALRNAPKMGDDFNVLNYKYVKDKMILAVISKDRNGEFLKDVPYKSIKGTDLVAIVKILVDENYDNGAAVTTVKQAFLDAYGISVEQLFKDALESAKKLRPIAVYGMLDLLREMMPDDMPFIFPDDADDKMYVARCSDVYGAAALAYDTFIDAVTEKIGNRNFYIIPSSVHEVIIVPEVPNTSPEDLRMMVQEVNDQEVAECDILSYNVYYCDTEKRILLDSGILANKIC